MATQNQNPNNQRPQASAPKPNQGNKPAANPSTRPGQQQPKK